MMTPADLARAIASAPVGGVVDLEPGFYGALVLKRAVTLRGPKDAEFSSVSVTAAASGARLEGFRVKLADSATISSATVAVKVAGTSTAPVRDVVVSRLTVRGGIALDGVEPDSDPSLPRPGERVKGLPNGKCVSVQWAERVTVEANDIGACLKGAGWSNSSAVVIRGNDIHDCRTSPIVGGDGASILIEGNRLHDARPWMWGAPKGAGDHGDFIHVFPLDGVLDSLTIRNNLIDQGSGEAILGIYLDAGAGTGFTNTAITDNTILLGNTQGMRLENVSGQVRRNLLLQVSGDGKDAPQIIVAGGSPVISNNRVADPRAMLAAFGVNEAILPGIQPAEALAVARWMAAGR